MSITRDASLFLGGAAACGLGMLLYSKLTSSNTPKKIKFEYFNIFGAGEKVRLAMALSDVSWDDVRITGDEWRGKDGKPSRKSAARYGQLPIMTLKFAGSIKTEIYQSDAMLRFVGSLDTTSKLYPADSMVRLKIDEALGLIADLDRSWRPCLALGFNPQKYGHPDDLDASGKSMLLEKIRTMWMKEEMPKYMKYFEDFIARNGGKFMCGNELSIADLQAVHKLNYYRLGFADHVPKTSMDQYPKMLQYINDVMNEPRVKQYYESKKE